MATHSRRPQLTGRSSELSVLDRLIDAVRAGQSRVLVVSGEPGVGKTALLDYLAGRAGGCRVECAAGVQSEMELAFAGLHLLCAPMLDRLDRLPGPQREALRTAFGFSVGPPPDRFLVGLAVLGLLSEVAEQRPLVCVVDDEQWLDRASAQALGFAARRLAADAVGLVFAAQVPGEDIAGLPGLAVEGLRRGDARALLDSVLAGPLDAQVRDRFVAETRGNPLALLEEASMVANPDLADVISQAAAADAKLILAGDTQQLQAVENGGGLSLLAGALGFVQLAEPVRFRAAWEQAASLRLRAGDATVLADYDQHARITGGEPEQMMDAAAAHYLALALDGTDVLLMAADHALRRELSRRIRDDLIRLGIVAAGPSVRIADGIRASAGDLIVCARNDHSIEAGEHGRTLANGDLLRIEAVTGAGLVVRRAARAARSWCPLRGSGRGSPPRTPLLGTVRPAPCRAFRPAPSSATRPGRIPGQRSRRPTRAASLPARAWQRRPRPADRPGTRRSATGSAPPSRAAPGRPHRGRAGRCRCTR